MRSNLDKPLYDPPVGYIIIGLGIGSWALVFAFCGILVLTVNGL